ncbi:MAG: magnesium transporter [Wenzhouxiangellaceae bacterium]
MAELNYQEKQVRQIHRITEALDEGTLARVRRMIATLSASEVADLLESLPPAKRLAAWELVDPDLDGEVLVEVNDEVRSQLIRGMDQAELVSAIGTLDIDDVADIVDDLPDAVIREVMASMDRQNREDLVRVLQYDEDSAGGLMSTDVVTVRPDVSLDVVQRYLRARGELPDLTDQLFVVNRSGKYQGCLSLHDLLTSDPELTVADTINLDMQTIPVSMPDNEVAREFTHYDLVSAPVVDAENNLLGRITIDDVIDVIREQAEHSVLAVAGLDEDEDMFAPVIKSAARRTLWLGINLLTAFLAAAVIGQFEDSLAAVVALAILMPVVASMGGIAGTQTLTLMVRGMALGQITAANALYMLRKELLVGVLNGMVWALVVGLVAMLWFRSVQLGLVIGVAIAVNLMVAALSGVGIPLLLRRLRIDPALAGGVVLTTVTDVIGFVVFLGLGTVVLLQ